MRAVLSAFCLAGVLASVVFAGPLSRKKRFAITPFGAIVANPYVGAFAGSSPFFGGFGGFGFARSGVNSGSVYPFFPDYTVPVIPFPQIPVFKNWYEGENVCKEEKVMNSQLPDDVIPADWKDDMPNVSTDFSHEQESCKGNDKKYVCVKRVFDNKGEAQIKATKYECCHGFVRNPTGAPGCVESKQPNPTGAAQGNNSKLTSNDPTYYLYSGSNSQGSMSRSSSGNIDKVPLQ